MVQIVPRSNWLGESFEKGFGQASANMGEGISTGLQALANLKLQQMQQRHQQQQTESALQGLPGMTPEIVKAIGGLPPQLANTYLQNILNEPIEREYAKAWNNMTQQNQSSQQELPTSQFAQPQNQMPSEQVVGPYTPYNVQQTPAQTTPQQPTMQQALPSVSRLKPQQFTQLMNYVAQTKKQVSKQQKDLAPIVTTQVKEYGTMSRAGRIAKEALNNLHTNSKQFPGMITGNLPEKLQQLLIRNPNVRKYQADINRLVKELSSTTKGNVTSLKIRLEQLAKANVSQPIETQEALLQEVIDESDRVANTTQFMESLKNKDGHLPDDTGSRLAEFDLAQDNPLQYPQYYSPGTTIEQNGAIYVNINGNQWKQIKG
jgi:hypothetical protein